MTRTVYVTGQAERFVSEQSNELSKGHNWVTVLDVFGWGDEEKKVSCVFN